MAVGHFELQAQLTRIDFIHANTTLHNSNRFFFFHFSLFRFVFFFLLSLFSIFQSLIGTGRVLSAYRNWSDKQQPPFAVPIEMDLGTHISSFDFIILTLTLMRTVSGCWTSHEWARSNVCDKMWKTNYAARAKRSKQNWIPDCSWAALTHCQIALCSTTKIAFLCYRNQWIKHKKIYWMAIEAT